jgi:hypothetical protein
MSKITIDTTNVSREEVNELKEYLEENCWKWQETDNVSREQYNNLVRHCNKKDSIILNLMTEIEDS